VNALYNNNQYYRFEVPLDEFDQLRSFLSDQGYGLVIADTIEEFVVVVKKYMTIPRTSSNSP
jgi:hypothetical protein